MGGGQKCDDTLYGGLEKSKIPFYEDATKQYCEDGVCLTLSDEKHECTSTIKSKFAGQVKNLKPYCGSEWTTGINAANFKYCIVEEDTKCVDATVFGEDGDFDPSDKLDCVELLEEDESLCPSKTWYITRGKKKCHCCPIAHTDPDFVKAPAKFDLYQLDIKSETSEDESTTDLIQSYSIPYLQRSSHDLFLYLLAIVGMFAVVNLVARICNQATKYSHIPEAQITEI